MIILAILPHVLMLWLSVPGVVLPAGQAVHVGGPPALPGAVW